MKNKIYNFFAVSLAMSGLMISCGDNDSENRGSSSSNYRDNDKKMEYLTLLKKNPKEIIKFLNSNEIEATQINFDKTKKSNNPQSKSPNSNETEAGQINSDKTKEENLKTRIKTLEAQRNELAKKFEKMKLQKEAAENDLKAVPENDLNDWKKTDSFGKN